MMHDASPMPLDTMPRLGHHASSVEPASASGGLLRANRQTLVEQVYGQVRRAITSGRFPPGQRLVIDDLAADLGVSITPVREALRQLQREGLVSDVPFSGMQVAAPSVAELKELYAVLGVLEGFAVRRAAELLSPTEIRDLGRMLDLLGDAAEQGDVVAFRRLNDRFHRRIVSRGAGDGMLMQLIEQLSRNVDRYSAAGDHLDRVYLEAAQAEHQQLYAYLRSKEGEAAESLARHHALTFAEHLMRRLEEQREDHAG
jgi:DNA-binding GntR family transcriptional regulator